MKFYEKILRELRTEEHTFRTLYNHAFSFSDHVYFEQSDNLRITRTTYEEARRTIVKMAGVFGKRVSHGQTVALIMPNGPVWVECFWALLQAGCSILLLSPLMPQKSLARCLENTGCSVVIGDTDIPGCEVIKPADLLAECANIADGTYTENNGAWGDEIILATSSTTGEAKLLAFNGRAICEQILNSEALLKTCKDVARFERGVIRQLAFLPFTHIFGLTACFLWFTIFGITFVFLKDLQPETILRTCRLHKVTHVFAVPLLWDTMNKRIRSEVASKGLTEKFEKLMNISLKLQDISRLIGRLFASCVFASVRKQTLGSHIKYCISGGGMLSKETLPLLNAVGYPLENGYGMTEIGIASLSTHKPGQRKGTRVGKPMTSLDFKLDENGQLLVRGSSCYTARYINGERVESKAGEYFATGDYFSVDETGEYTFIGRMDDLVNGSNGERISPDEIENQMALNLESCVFGAENGNLALMVRLPEQCYFSENVLNSEVAKLRAAIDTLPTYMRPQQILVSRHALPLSLSGKIRRQAIKRGVQDGTYACDKLSDIVNKRNDRQEGENDALTAVMCEMFKAHSHTDQEVESSSHFFSDLGGDSLSFLELVGSIETRFNIRLTDELSVGMTTPSEAARIVTAQLEGNNEGAKK